MKNILEKTLASPKRKILLIMFFVFLFILADILCENFLGIVYNKQPVTREFLLFFGFVLLQILFAPIQSGLSDRYGRKKSLGVSLFFSFLSLVILYIFDLKSYFALLVLATIFKGVFGNTLPISLAVIADTKNKNYRVLFAFSTAAYALAYLILASIENSSAISLDTYVNYYLIVFFLVIFIFCVKFFWDPEDKGTVHLKNSHSIGNIFKQETQLLVKDMKFVPTQKALAAFFLWETSLYSILLSQVDFQINKATHVAQYMMYGYLFGVAILIFCYKFKDNTIVKIGYWVSFLSLVPYFILFKIIDDQSLLLRVCYFFHALGNAFLSPALLSMLAKERQAHEQGRIYGLADSVDTAGYLCATLAIMLYNSLKLNLIFLVSFSFLVFAVSWKYYSRFQNVNK